MRVIYTSAAPIKSFPVMGSFRIASLDVFIRFFVGRAERFRRFQVKFQKRIIWVITRRTCTRRSVVVVVGRNNQRWKYETF